MADLGYEVAKVQEVGPGKTSDSFASGWFDGAGMAPRARRHQCGGWRNYAEGQGCEE